MHKGRGLLAIAMLALLLTGCQKQHHAKAVEDLSGSPTARDGGQVQVVESGFTVMPGTSSSNGANEVSVGFDLQNTSKTQEAQSADVFIALYDAAGTLLYGTKQQEGTGAKTLAPAIEPGERTSVGLKLTTDDGNEKGLKAVRLQVIVGEADWVPPHRKPTLTTTGAHLVKQIGGDGVLTFTVQAPDLGSWAQQQLPRISVLFLNSTGKIIGGYPFGRQDIAPWTAGANARTLELTAVRMSVIEPPGADLARTEVQASIDGG